MGSKTNTQSTQSGPPPQVYAAYSDLLSRAQQVASTPYQAYSGSMLAPFSGSQQTAFNTIDQAQGIAKPFIDTAQQYATQGAAAITPEQIQQYFDPFAQRVIGATQANFDEANARQLAQVRGNAIAKGSLGGDRVGVAQGEAVRQQQLAQAPVIAGLNSQAFQTALSAAQQDAARRGQAAYTFGNLGQEALGTTLTAANAQLGSGALQQQQAQAGLNIPYQQWLQQQAFPYQQTGWLGNIVTGVGSQMGGTSTTTSPGPNPYAQYAGLGLAAAGMFLKDGGAVKGYAEGGIAVDHPWGRAAGWIPGSTFAARGNTIPRASAAPQADSGVNKMVSNAMGLADQMRGKREQGIGQPLNLAPAGISGTGDFYSPGVPVADGMSPIFARGGMVLPSESGIYVPRGYADGGMPLNDLVYRPDFDVPGTSDLVYRPGVGAPPQFIPAAADNSPSARVAQSYDAVAPLQQFPSLADVQARDAPPEIQAAVDNPPVPLPRRRPADADAIPMASVAPSVEPTASAQADTAGQPAIPLYDAMGPNAGYGQPAQPQGWRDRLHSIAPALVSAGFGMMASRSPFLGTAIGEGGLAGVHAYNEMKAIERDEAQKQRQFGLQERNLDLSVRRLDQSAKQAADNLKMHTEQQAEAARHNRAVETAPKVVGQTLVTPKGEVLFKNSTGLLDDETVDAMAGQYLSGDKSVMQNLGRGAQGSENIVRLRAAIQRQAKEANMTPAQIAVKMAEFQGLTAAQRTLGTRTANVEMPVAEAQKLMPLVLDSSEKVDRTKYPALNNIILAGERGTGDENVVRFGIAVNSLINVYARAISPTGVPTVSDKEHARELLSTAWSKGQVRAAIDQLNKEMEAARQSPEAVQQKLRTMYGGSKEGAGGTETPKVGTRKRFKQGEGEWDGTKWVPVNP